MVILIAFAVIAVVFSALEVGRRWSKHERRAQLTTDLCHVLLSSTASAGLVDAVALTSLAWFAAYFPRGSFHLLEAKPLWLQVTVLVLLGEASIYTVHRAFHRVDWLWPFHRVHHSPGHMDWLNGFRSHVVETAIHRILPLVPLAVMGFAKPALEIYGIISVFFTAFAHLDVPWRFGWLNYVLVTPEFHRWHHELEDTPEGANFAGRLAFFDWILGTARYECCAEPEQLGIHERLPESWVGQQISPFRDHHSSERF